jgi:cytochrome c peroxidase
MNQPRIPRNFNPLTGSLPWGFVPSRTVAGVIALIAMSACSDSTTTVAAGGAAGAVGGGAAGAMGGGTAGSGAVGVRTGEQLFREPFPGTNGRSCATCHVPEDNFTLTPEHVARVLATNPNDPLFSAIDADDPTARTLSFEHLKKGLIRVWLALPDNMDLIDDTGSVITPPDRKLFVWRGVPSIADAALTAPYQLDGRVTTLEEQAQGAVTGHSEGGKISASELTRIADFERTVFSSDRSRSVAEYLTNGGAPASAPSVDDALALTPSEERGRELYKAVCGKCHGGYNQATITDRELHDLAIPALKPDGTVRFQVPATDPPTPVLAAQPNNEFLNIASAFEMYLALLGATEHDSFTKDVGFPNYRYRFYADGSRTQITADLPPAAPPFDPGAGGGGGPPGGGPGDSDAGGGGPAGGGFNIELDSDNNPLVGPNFVPQFFSTDPGRAVITGSPNDFEAFAVPTLRGIAKTAPYYHNNTVETLEEVVNLYSDHLLNRFPSLIQPGEKEPDPDGDTGNEETFTAAQKADLVAFLKRL